MREMKRQSKGTEIAASPVRHGVLAMTAARSAVVQLQRGYLTVVLTASIMALAAVGCGVYSFNPKGKSSIKTVAIEPFENKTSEFGFTDRLTEIVTDAFIKDGNLKVVPAANADAVLIGTLLSYNRTPLQFDLNDQVSQYKVRLEFEIVLRNPQDQSEILNDRFTQEASYDAVEETEEDGQRKAGEKLVAAILNRTTKSW